MELTQKVRHGRKGEKKRDELLEAAERLFFEHGYHFTPLQALLDKVKCSKGSFYHYFTTKLDVLTALCERRAQAAYALYETERVQTPVQRLNALLYYALPFRAGEEDFLYMLAPLRGGEENAACYGAWAEALRDTFKPELSRALEALRETGAAHYSQPALPDLLWETHVAFFFEATAAIYLQSGRERQLLDVVCAARFAWERLLDAPFGAIEVVRLPELLAVSGRVAARLSADSRA